MYFSKPTGSSGAPQDPWCLGGGRDGFAPPSYACHAECTGGTQGTHGSAAGPVFFPGLPICPSVFLAHDWDASRTMVPETDQPGPQPCSKLVVDSHSGLHNDRGKHMKRIRMATLAGVFGLVCLALQAGCCGIGNGQLLSRLG